MCTIWYKQWCWRIVIGREILTNSITSIWCSQYRLWKTGFKVNTSLKAINDQRKLRNVFVSDFYTTGRLLPNYRFVTDNHINVYRLVSVHHSLKLFSLKGFQTYLVYFIKGIRVFSLTLKIFQIGRKTHLSIYEK